MTIYSALLLGILDSDSKEAFINDEFTSSMWGDKLEEEVSQDVADDRVKILSNLYDAATRSVKEIAVLSNMSQRKLAERFNIPYRTMENWCTNTRECPLYTKMMVQECLGLFKPDKILFEKVHIL